MVSDLWRLREAIDRGTIKGLYYGDVKTDLVDALDRLIDMEESSEEDLLIKDMNATQSLQHLHDRVDVLEQSMKDIEGALDNAVSEFDSMEVGDEVLKAQEKLIEGVQKSLDSGKD